MDYQYQLMQDQLHDHCNTTIWNRNINCWSSSKSNSFSVILNLTIPLDDVLIEQVAAAPLPPPPVIVIVGASVYPNPAFVINIFSTDVTFALEL